MAQKTALILLNYNDAPSLLSALERGLSLDGIDLCIAVDNGSADDSLERILAAVKNIAEGTSESASGRFPGECFRSDRLLVLETGRNGGYGFGNNAGIRAAAKEGCELALIANPDVCFGSETLAALKAAFSADAPAEASEAEAAFSADAPAVASEAEAASPAVSADAGRKGRVLAAGAVMEGHSPEECAWPLKDFCRELYASGPISRRLFKKEIYYTPPLTAPVAVGAVHGALVMVRVKEFLELGGFDEQMFLFGEERVLGRKIAAAGGRVLLVPAVYRHTGSETMKKNGLSAVKREKERLKSEAYYYKKYLGAGPCRMAFCRIFQSVVMAETRVAAALGLL